MDLSKHLGLGFPLWRSSMALPLCSSPGIPIWKAKTALHLCLYVTCLLSPPKPTQLRNTFRAKGAKEQRNDESTLIL